MAIELIKYALALAFFISMLILGIVYADGTGPADLLVAALWCVMSGLTIFYAGRDCLTKQARARFRRRERAPRPPRRLSFWVRAGLAGLGLLFVQILLRLLEDELALAAGAYFLMPAAVWMATFLCAVLSYPLQKRQPEGIDSLPAWAVVSACLGLVGVALFHVEHWLG